MARVLIIGASKGIGLEAVKQALAKGHQVRALARSADRIAIRDPSLEKTAGSALDADDVTTALTDVDAVILALGVSAGPEMVLRPVHLFSDATGIVLQAMNAAGVNRLICVTGFGAGDSRDSLSCLGRVPFQLILGRVYDDKSAQEQLIRQSELDWVIARPVILTSGPRTGRYRVLAEPGTWRNGIISRADVADFLVGQIDDDTYLGQTPVIAY